MNWATVYQECQTTLQQISRALTALEIEAGMATSNNQLIDGVQIAGGSNGLISLFEQSFSASDKDSMKAWAKEARYAYNYLSNDLLDAVMGKRPYPTDNGTTTNQVAAMNAWLDLAQSTANTLDGALRYSHDWSALNTIKARFVETGEYIRENAGPALSSLGDGLEKALWGVGAILALVLLIVILK